MSKIQYPVVMGWYIGAISKEPIYDPGLVPCPYCGIKTTDDNIRTFNLMAEDRDPALSVFYRSHRTCHEQTDDEGKRSIDNFVIQALETMSQVRRARTLQPNHITIRRDNE